MFRGNRARLEETVLPAMDYFDGLIAVIDDSASLETIQWLDSIKKDGQIIVKKWVNDHAHTMNEFLLSGVMEYPDYFVIIDETDKLNKVFLNLLRENIYYWDNNNVGAIWLDHPFILRYHSGLRVVKSPHWTITNIIGQIVNLTTIDGYNKKCYLENLRDKDVLRSAFLSPIKYWFCYPPFSNHTELLYRQFSDEIWHYHERLRINFQFYCKNELQIPLTMDGLKDYLINNVGKYPDYFEQIIEAEVNLKDAFRLFVLKEPWENLAKNRFNFSYYKWKKTGIVNQPKIQDYEGVFNTYRKQKGLSPE